jgi:hypothetical protein
MGASIITCTLSSVTLLGLIALAGCGDQQRASSQPSSTASRPSGHAVEYRYDAKDKVEGEPFAVHVDAIVAGSNHARIRLEETGFAPRVYVWDGVRLLVHDPEAFRPWILYEAPDEHPDSFGLVEAYLPDPGLTRLKHDCKSAAVVGHKTILGRDATGYHCAGQHFPDGSSMDAYVVWVDPNKGLLLQQDSMHLSSAGDAPPVTSATFSTDPPPGAKVQHFGARTDRSGSPVEAADFHLKLSDGTDVALADYAGKPLVLVFVSSDLAFGMADGCPRCASAFQTLRTETAGGTRPAVLMVQGGEEGKPGSPWW